MNLTKEMNQEFCQEHEFNVVGSGDSILIKVNKRVKELLRWRALRLNKVYLGFV